MIALWIVAIGGAFWWLLQGVCIVRTVRSVRPLLAGTIESPPVGDAPLVSVICPARDEADAIEAAVVARLADASPWLEFIFVDDRSADGTGGILDRAAANDARCRVVHNTELPEGWLGKVHAQQVGVDHARVAQNGWYLFSDGDTHVLPGAIEAALAFATREQADHVAMTPRIVRAPWLLGLCLAPLMRVLISTLRLWQANDDSSPRAFGVGAFNLVRRSALDHAGGLEQLRMEIADDVGIGQIIKDSGGRSRLVTGEGWCEIQWYRTNAQFLAGSEKGAGKARTRGNLFVTLVLLAFVLTLDVSPLVLLAWLPTPPAMLASATAALALCLSLTVAARFSLPRWWSLAWPIGVMAGGCVAARAMMLAIARGGIRWRGDGHALDETAAGERVRL